MVTEVKDSQALATDLRPVLLRLNRELKREIHSLGVTGGQVSLLVSIKQRPGVTAKELAELDRVSAAAMSVSLGRLEKGGLIERTRGEDRRCVSVTLSAAGEKVLRSVKQRRTAWLAARLKDLDDDDREAIDAALPALARLL
ncbi:MAG TPA: MarR family transcriptional regulator [Gaiellaceae bacterium]|nr:MarR family transcriptional regulator [Gaiellaceae bacterium]